MALAYVTSRSVTARNAVVNGLAASPLLTPRIRAWVLRGYGISIGERVWVKPRCFFGGHDIALGAGTYINYGCFFDNGAPITIGENCSFGMQVLICTGTHDVGGAESRAGRAYASPVVVGSGCWLGARCIILPGVIIGPGCVIAAGAVVVSDCDADGLYAGVPARRIRDLPTSS